MDLLPVTEQFVSIKNSIRDACTPQPGEIVFNTVRYRSSETVQRSEYKDQDQKSIKTKQFNSKMTALISKLQTMMHTYNP